MVYPSIIVQLPDQSQKEMEVSRDISIGRARDNVIVIENNGVARRHALLEMRADGVWLINLNTGSILVNQQTVSPEYKLQDNDLINIAGIATIKFFLNGKAKEIPVLSSPVLTPNTNEELLPTQDSNKWKYAIAIAPVAIIFIVASLLYYHFSVPTSAIVHIVSPLSGSTIKQAVPIRLQVENGKNIERVVYQLNGKDFASVETPPYETVIEPKMLLTHFPNLNLTNGTHNLSIATEDIEGNRKIQEDILLAFELDTTPTNPSPINSGENNFAAMPTLLQSLASQISRKSGYVFEQEVLEKIQLRTKDYAIDIIPDARRYRREIAKAFGDKGLDPLLGFIIAFSKTKFKADSGELWALPPTVAQNYLSTEELQAAMKDPKRSAEVAATYTKDLLNSFGGIENFILAIAYYGQPLNEVGNRSKQIKQSLSVNSKNLAELKRAGLIDEQAMEQVINFFAAGIVGENPQMFQLQTERISALY